MKYPYLPIAHRLLKLALHIGLVISLPTLAAPVTLATQPLGARARPIVRHAQLALLLVRRSSNPKLRLRPETAGDRNDDGDHRNHCQVQPELPLASGDLR